MDSAKTFYDSEYSGSQYASFPRVEVHFAFEDVRRFVDSYQLDHKKCLEVGSGRGLFQGMVEDYTGFDLSDSVRAYYQKPFVVGTAEELPFPDAEFDAVWSITVLEHIPNPEKCLAEIRRVLRPGGYLLLKPAWNCRPWNCEGIPVRPYSELTARQRWIKATLRLRNSIITRACKAIPRRIFQTWIDRGKRDLPLRFSALPADYQTFWMADSDACSSIDPYDVIAWYRSRGDNVLSHPSVTSAIFSRSEPLVVRRGP